MTKPDNYAYALVQLKQTAIFLYGIGVGYNNPRSERDRKLADEIGALLEKHAPRPSHYIVLCKGPDDRPWRQVYRHDKLGPFCTTNPDEAKTFMKEMSAKWFTTEYRVVEIKDEDRT